VEEGPQEDLQEILGEENWRYPPSNLPVHIGDAVGIVYYSQARGHWRVHDGIYLGGPFQVIDNGKRPQPGTKFHPYMIGHYRQIPGTNQMCHEVIKVSAPLRLIRTSHQPYKADNPTIKPYHPPCGPGNTINRGIAVALKIPGDVKNGLLLQNTCISFPNHNGKVAINHFKLRGGESAWKNFNQPPTNQDIIAVSHVYQNVSFVKAATLSKTTDCP
jgi:hypothetical protein